MDYSFYGGRRGTSFILSGRFRFVAAADITAADDRLITAECEASGLTREQWVLKNCMIEAFSQGPQYTVVNYDEYVLIDSFNKNSPDNGKIYRRGYNYSNEFGGAEYLGQIVGPSGLAPAVEMTTIEAAKAIQEQEGYEYRKTEGAYGPAEENIVPGKIESPEGVVTYNDEISWYCCSVRDEFNKDTVAYVGFTFPYTVIDFAAQQISAYQEGNIHDFTTAELIQRIDDKAHPFFEKWQINIPKGIKGDFVKDVRTMVATDEVVYPESLASQKAEDVKNQRQIFVYDYYSYAEKESGVKLGTYYIGNYNVVSNIQVEADGTLRITYTYEPEAVSDKLVKWLSEVTINTGETEGTGNQKVHLLFNDGTEQDIGNPINYIAETAITPDYQLLLWYSSPDKRAAIPAESKFSYNGKEDWFNCGCVKSENGILIGTNYDITDFPDATVEGIIAKLNLDHPDAFKAEGLDQYAKVVTVGQADQNKLFFAFDFTKVDGVAKGWYYLGTIQEVPGVIMGAEDDPNTSTIAATLPPHSLWFVTEDI